MKTKRIISLASAAMLSAQAVSIPVSAETSYHNATLTVNVYDSETGELFKGEGNFLIGRGESVGEGMGGGAMYGSWSPAKQNPYVTDIGYQDGYLFLFSFSNKGEYMIDESKCSPAFTLDNCTEKEIDLYLTGTNNTISQPVSDDITEIPDKSEITFDDLLAMSDDELKAFCEKNGLEYRPTVAGYGSRGMELMLTPDDYKLTDEITVSPVLEELGRGGVNDYDISRMVSDLNFPEEYYNVYPGTVSFENYAECVEEENGEIHDMFYKLAAVGVTVSAGAEEKYPMDRLLVLIPVWAGMNRNYRHFRIPQMGGVIAAQTSESAKGDANTDGKINVSDAVAVLQYISNSEKYPLTPEGIENADCDGDPGVTGSDALAIQRIDAGLESEPVQQEKTVESAQLLEVEEISMSLPDGSRNWSGSILTSAQELDEYINAKEYYPVLSESVSDDLFTDKAVIVIYSREGSGSQYSVISNMAVSGSTLNVSTVTRMPEVVTCDIVVRRYIYSVPLSEVEGISGISFTDSFSCEKDDRLGDEIRQWFREWLDEQMK